MNNLLETDLDLHLQLPSGNSVWYWFDIEDTFLYESC